MTDHEHGNLTIVTCFIPTASLCSSSPRQLTQHLSPEAIWACRPAFVHLSLRTLTAFCVEEMVRERADEKQWFGISIKPSFKLFLSVPPHILFSQAYFRLTTILWMSVNSDVFYHLLLTIFLITVTKSRVHALSMNNQWLCSSPFTVCGEICLGYKAFDCATAPFHTNGNDAFCFSVTGEWLPIFRSHCRVVHSCISLHTCVRGTGNGCRQHNRSMRMRYKSLIMPESWTGAVKSARQSVGSTAST